MKTVASINQSIADGPSKMFLFFQDGKYLIVKDPNKPTLRLYDIPDNTFDSEDSDESSDEGLCLLCFVFGIVLFTSFIYFMGYWFQGKIGISNTLVEYIFVMFVLWVEKIMYVCLMFCFQQLKVITYQRLGMSLISKKECNLY